MQSSSLPLSAVYRRTTAGQRAALGAGPELADADARLLLRLNGYTPLRDLLVQAELLDAATQEAMSRLASGGLIEPAEEAPSRRRKKR